MKKINFLLTAILLLGVLAYSGCGSTEAPAETAAEKQLNALSGQWSATAGSVTRDGNAETAYDNFTVSFSGSINANKDNVDNGTFTTNDTADPAVFPSGTWSFDGGNTTVILRGSGVKMNITSVNETTLVLAFSLNEDGTTNRTQGLSGNWIFTLTK